MCHIILLMPLVALPVFWLAPLPYAMLAYGIVLGLSIWLYAFLWKGLRRPVVTGREALVGKQGTLIALAGGRPGLWIQGEAWPVHSRQLLAPGDPVRIVGVDGLCLDVEPAKPARAGAPAGG